MISGLRRFSRRFSTWQLPEVPLSDTLDDAVIRQLVPREARLVESKQEAEELLPELLAARVLGLDCEGVALGRWGRLCLCQVATPQQVFLFDGLRTGVVEVLRPVLTSTAVTKVMHDSREDSSAFLSQFDIELAGVFDSQVAHTMMLENQATKPFQISLNELLKSVLKLENEKETSLGQRMKKDPNIWFYRPMKEDLLTYAAQDVMYLPLLHRRLCDQLGDRTGNRVMSRSQEYVKYARMNLHLSSPKAAQRRHLRLQAMLATHTDAALYFKLNLGAHRQGVVSREEALKNFKDMHYGQIADCWVSAWNTGGNILFLERLEANAMPEPERKPGNFGWRRRRRPVGPKE
ncbi:unnamed protein product [Effrenium voratum]|uniref:3'-5' exonuclease domain-containing protein n=1 Tax=Effrenium voratum TaxID=2562239 RepID=A0AA36JJN3_9DINO|nr:unnamed protein product [Effrenium voratum]CAJ1433827.1 unnamed protein product [Effrenium voratum]